jgi:hypothetical protein
MAMTLETERELYSRSHRLFGLPSSRIAADTVTGNDTKISFEDYLNGTINLYISFYYY